LNLTSKLLSFLFIKSFVENNYFFKNWTCSKLHIFSNFELLNNFFLLITQFYEQKKGSKILGYHKMPIDTLRASKKENNLLITVKTYKISIISLEIHDRLTCPNLWYKRKSSAPWPTSSLFQLMNFVLKVCKKWKINLICDEITKISVILTSKTVAADPVQLMRMSPRHLVGCFNPKRASTFAL
jgi:hypothetical protein